MDESLYFIRGRRLRESDPALQEALAQIYGTSERPRCMCVPGGIEMYIAKLGEYVVKRMPETGGRHHPGCESFEPEPAASGLGELIGRAVVEHTPERVELRTSFPLARSAGRSITRIAGQGEPAEVQAQSKGLSLRALLHFLYERAGFNRWYPAMNGKRTQGVLHKYLTLAASGVSLKGVALEERLYVPEPFRLDLKDEIAERRRRKLCSLSLSSDHAQQKLAIVIGEFNGVEEAGTGYEIKVKHMADLPLHVDRTTWEKAARSYAPTLDAVNADVEHKPRVLMALLICAKREHLYEVDSITCMLVSRQWLPLEATHELPLIDALQQQGRKFIKPLRYDLNSTARLASALLLDCDGAPRAMHVISPFLNARDRAVKERTVAELGDQCWVWHTDQPMSEFPPLLRMVSEMNAAVQARFDDRGECGSGTKGGARDAIRAAPLASSAKQ